MVLEREKMVGKLMQKGEEKIPPHIRSVVRAEFDIQLREYTALSMQMNKELLSSVPSAKNVQDPDSSLSVYIMGYNYT